MPRGKKMTQQKIQATTEKILPPTVEVPIKENKTEEKVHTKNQKVLLYKENECSVLVAYEDKALWEKKGYTTKKPEPVLSLKDRQSIERLRLMGYKVDFS